MSIFKDMLQSGESLFKDSIFLSYDFQPKILYGRENEQRQFAIAIKPLLQGHSGRNIFVYGAPGIGKTTACKHVLRELEEETDDVIPIYINCWKDNTTYKIFLRICEDLGLKFIQNKKTTELLDLIKSRLNKRSAVLVFDEIDKLEDTDFIYTLLEDIYRSSIFLITNYRDSYANMDERIRSRLNPEFVYFRPYSESEIAEILKRRMEFAFVSGCWDDEAFKEIVEKSTETKDVRIGLYLMREAGNLAEDKSSRSISSVEVAEAIKKVENFHIKDKEDLDDNLQTILEIVKQNSGKKVGDLYASYGATGGKLSYKSFYRRIMRLNDAKFCTTERVSGNEGNATIVRFASEKKLTDF